MSESQIPQHVIDSALDEIRQGLQRIIDTEGDQHAMAVIAGLGMHAEVALSAAKFAGAIVIGATTQGTGHTGCQVMSGPGSEKTANGSPSNPVFVIAATQANQEAEWPQSALDDLRRNAAVRKAVSLAKRASSKPEDQSQG